MLELEIEKLKMWNNNARFDYELKDEDECIRYIFENQELKKKTLKLLDKILEDGKILEPLIVLYNPILFGNNYIVLDGNRRLSLFKLIKHEDFIKKYKIDIKKINCLVDNIKKLTCIVYNDIEEAYNHIENRHLGEQGGQGIVSWSPKNKDRMKKIRDNGSDVSIGTKIMDFYDKTDNLKYQYVKEKIKDKSTLDRIFKNKYITHNIFKLNNPNEYNLEKDSVTSKINEILELFYKENSNVTSVYLKEQIEEKFNSIEPLEYEQQSLQITFPQKEKSNENISIYENVNNEKKNNYKGNNYNNYKNNKKSTLFNWENSGIDIDSDIFKKYLKNLIILFSEKTDYSDFIFITVPFFYRVLLESALRAFYKFLKNNDALIYINNQKINNFKTETNDDNSLVSLSNIMMLFEIDEINKFYDKYIMAKDSIAFLKRKKFNQKNSNNISRYLGDLNKIIHGKEYIIDDNRLQEIDNITLNLLKIISSLMNPEK